MGTTPPAKIGPVTKAVVFLYFALSILAVIPMLLRSFFLPVHGSAASSQSPLVAAVVLIGVLSGVFLVIAIKPVSSMDSLKDAIVAAAASAFSAFVVYAAFFAGLPLIYSAVLGNERDVRVVVENPRASSQKSCRHRVELRDSLFFFDSLCGLTEEFRSSLKPGDQLTVSGKGSKFGIFVRSVKKAQ